MTIYVDNIQHYPTGPWCHMASDRDLSELHEFAQEIGLKPEWFQAHERLEHYGLRPVQRLKAIEKGAIPVNHFQLLIICTDWYQKMKEKTMRDLGLWVENPEPTGIVNIYTDGGCWPNPGIGGWGAILMWGDGHEKRISGSCQDTTNSRMELTAAIEALTVLEKPSHVIINTDSKYLMLGYTRWLQGWIDREWKTANGNPVKNQDLWFTLIAAAAPHTIEWYHVKGHNGNIYNEEADRLATEAREELAERMQNAT